MFLKTEREALAVFDLCADGPVLVASGKSCKTDPTLPATIFLTGRTDKNEDNFVIPGSSIKGVIRHYIQEYMPDSEVKKLFGKTEGQNNQKSKICFHDAYADMDTIVSEVRKSTAINKIDQSAKSGSLNNMQAVVKGAFRSGFKITNFDNDELKNIMKALMAINDGEICIGGRTSRGFGRMKVENFSITITKGYTEDLKPDIVKICGSPESVIEYLSEGVSVNG